jgi:hypothetical protein
VFAEYGETIRALGDEEDEDFSPDTSWMPVRHYMGDAACPDCRSTYDPVTGYCPTCDPVLYRVVGYPDEYFDDEMAPPIDRVVASRNLADVVAEVVTSTGRFVEVSLA